MIWWLAVQESLLQGTYELTETMTGCPGSAQFQVTQNLNMKKENGHKVPPIAKMLSAVYIPKRGKNQFSPMG